MTHSSRGGISSQAVDTIVERAIDRHLLVGVVVFAALDGDIVYSRAAGLADREAGTPMQTDTIFRLASLTKPIVTAAAMRMVEDGALDLDALVTRYLPEFRPLLPDGSAVDIPIRTLLSHTSGLSYSFGETPDSDYRRRNVSDGIDQPGLSLEENMRRLAGTRLRFAPGTGWRYSLAMDVIGAVLGAITGEDLATIVRRLVTEPLGMDDTAFRVTDRSRLAVPYRDARPQPEPMGKEADLALLGGTLRFAPDRIFDPASYPSGGGGMAGTAPDFMRFLEAMRGGGAPLLKSSTVETMMVDRTPAGIGDPGWGFGYGWSLLTDPAAAGAPQNAGTFRWGGVYGHSWFVDPVRRLSVVTLSNTAFEGMNGPYTLDLRNAFYA